MKLHRFLLIFIIFLYIIWPDNITWAEDEDVDTQTSIVLLSIPNACKLVISDSDVTKTLAQDGSAEIAFDNGYTEFDLGKPNLTVSANNSWKLSARSSGFTAPWLKPVGDLQLKDTGSLHVTNGFNSYKALTDTDQEIALYTGGVRDEIHPCQYKILLDWTKDIPGTYTATVTYTLTTNGS